MNKDDLPKRTCHYCDGPRDFYGLADDSNGVKIYMCATHFTEKSVPDIMPETPDRT